MNDPPQLAGEDLLVQLLEAAPDAMVVSDVQGKIAFVNQAAERLFGYRRGDMCGRDVEMLVPERVQAHHHERRRQYQANPHMRRMGSALELAGRRQDGTEFPADISLGPVRVNDQLFVVTAIRDITKRREADKALRDSEERFYLAVRGTDAGIWDWDLDTDTIYFSPRWKSMLGFQEDEISSTFSEWEQRLHPDDRQRAFQVIHDYLEGRSADYELEHRLQHKDGSYRWILSRGAVVRDADGRAHRMVGSHLDITDRKSTAEQLRQREAELTAAQQIQQRLLPQAPPRLPGWDIAGVSLPAEFAAGDHYDFLRIAAGRFAAVLGDVSGHGIGPALVMACTHAHLRSLSRLLPSMPEVVRETNAVLASETADEHFVTLIVAVLDPATGQLEYINAGHPPGCVFDRDGRIKAHLDEAGYPLGILKEYQPPVAAPLQLDPGDVVLLLSDGVLEARAPDGSLFGRERLLQAVRQHRDASAQAIVAGICQALQAFSQSQQQLDDVTMVVIRRLHPDESQPAGTDAPDATA